MGATGAVLLAAGGGSRFAGPGHKLLAPINGRPLIARSLGNLTASGLTPAVVITGAVALDEWITADIDRIHNPDWEQGMATSLAVAVRWGTDRGLDAVVVGLGDQPDIAPDAWVAVALASRTPIAVATYGGRRGHPVRLGREVWDRLPTTGDQGARAVMARSPELVTEVACDGDPADVDTVEDLNRWR